MAGEFIVCLLHPRLAPAGLAKEAVLLVETTNSARPLRTGELLSITVDITVPSSINTWSLL